MIKIITLIGVAVIVAAMVICRPNLLSQNTILLGLINHEILALMSVILTVTLASVANIHLAMNRIVAQKFGNNPEIKRAADAVKKELKDNCWYIFWGFVVAVVLILVKGGITNNNVAIAVIHGSVIWVLCLYLLCMYDVYQVVFGVADMDDGNSGASSAPDMSADGGDHSA